MKRLTIALALCLAPLAAAAETYTASLSGTAGTGFANLVITGSTIDYTIVTSGLDPAPTTASLVSGGSSIDLEPTFMNGTAIGSVTSSQAAAIVADPSSWTVEVGNGADVLSGALVGAGGNAEDSTLVFPVAANVTGLANANFVTDARILNLGDDTATVTLDYYVEGAAGNSAPTATVTMTVAGGQQAVLDDIVASEFNQAGTKGAVVATADAEIIGSMRIYNDLRDAGEGTLGQYVKGIGMDDAMTSGSLLFLSNEDATSGMGYRANIGWFNANEAPVEVTLTAYDADGTMLGEKTFAVNAMAQEQFAVSSAKLWPELDPYGDFYLMYEVAGSHGLFVYGSVVDNVNGDAIFVSAQ